MIEPVFLWGLAAISIPLLIHLRQRRRFKEISVGTLRFLRATVKRRRFRLRFEEVPLLLLRCAALVLLALMFARPLFHRSDPADRPVARTLILVDASGSVTQRMAEAARDAARSAARDASGSEFTIAAFSDQVAELDSLDDYTPRAGAPSDFGGALEWAINRLESAPREDARVVLIGHFSSNSRPFHPPRVWPPRIDCELIPLSPPSEGNSAVRDLTLLTPFVGEEMAIEARVLFAAGSKQREVHFETDGILQSAMISPDHDRVVFRFKPPGGVVRGQVRIDSDDPWRADDRRPFVMRWTHPKRVLLLDGDPGETPFDGQAYFVEKALAASGAAHGRSPIQAEIRYGLEDRQGLADLAAFQVVALCGVTELSAESADALAGFVEDGGNLIQFLDERWSPAAAAPLVGHGLFPDGVQAIASRLPKHLSEWDAEHPAFKSLNATGAADLRELPWLDAFRLPATGDWKTIATLEGGHPLMIQKSEPGNGRILVLGHPMTRRWSELPRDPLFVPLMKDLFGGLAREDAPGPPIIRRTPGIAEARPIGIYDLPGGGSEVIAADPDETLVASVSPDVFRAAFGLPSETPSAGPAPNEIPETRDRAAEWWPWICLSLLLLLIVENLVATRRIPVATHG